jgi:nitrite reductase/ring-hydroxylating ferredoxin subunit
VSGSLVLGALIPMIGLDASLAGLPVAEAVGVQTGSAEHAYAIPSTDGATIDKKTQVIVVRNQQKVYAFNLACPHENTALKWREGDRRFQCPKHESKYTPDGTFTSGRATRNMDRFAVRREGNQLLVALDHLYRSDQQPKEWGAAVIQL